MRLREKRFGRNEFLYSIACVFILATGFVAYTFVDRTTNEENYERLVARASSLAVLFDAPQFETLTVSEADLENPAYIDLKQKLIDIREVNVDISFVYLMAMRDGAVFFIADSEEPDSEDYSPPGQEYTEATDELKSTWLPGTPYVLEISEDRWGEWISALAPIRDESGTAVAVLGLDQNAVTHRLIFRTQVGLIAFAVLALLTLVGLLYALQKREQDLVDLKNDFVAIASHELRTPLSGIRWTLAGLKDDPRVPEGLRQEIAVMHERLRSLIERMSALLQITALDQGAVQKSEFERVDIAPIVRDAVLRARLAAAPKNISIQSPEFSEQIPVRGNTVYLQLIFDNLLTNAIKYSPESSSVEISYTKTTVHTFTIKDQGMGIPQDELKKVFGGFHRARNAKSSGSPGSGFGLYVTKKIVELHGGTITCESKIGKGTTFSVTLPRTV